ncbi:MAG: hypothetical protein WCC97_10810 [Candidatus Acidiferrales bacterium]
MADKPLYIGPCIIIDGGGVKNVATVVSPQGLEVAVPLAPPPMPKFPDQSVKVALNKK